MLDRFVYGAVERISPEAPIPVLRIDREAVTVGGAIPCFLCGPTEFTIKWRYPRNKSGVSGIHQGEINTQKPSPGVTVSPQ